MNRRRIAPSILSADFARLGEEAERLERAGAQLLHIDVMDGHFVPNISFGPAVMKSLAGRSGLPFDVHLMISEPDRYAADFVCEQTDCISFHCEAVTHLHRSVMNLKSLGVKAGVALNPGTPLCAVEELLGDLDRVVLMSVNPGFGGQSFIESVRRKLVRLVGMREETGLDFEIEIDGGVTLENVSGLCEAGADIFVTGSSVFKDGRVEENVRAFLEKTGEK